MCPSLILNLIRKSSKQHTEPPQPSLPLPLQSSSSHSLQISVFPSPYTPRSLETRQSPELASYSTSSPCSPHERSDVLNDTRTLPPLLTSPSLLSTASGIPFDDTWCSPRSAETGRQSQTLAEVGAELQQAVAGGSIHEPRKRWAL